MQFFKDALAQGKAVFFEGRLVTAFLGQEHMILDRDKDPVRIPDDGDFEAREPDGFALEVRTDPLTGTPFAVVLRNGHGRKTYAWSQHRVFFGRIEEAAKILRRTTFASKRSASEVRSRLQSMMNGISGRRPKAPRRMLLGPELHKRVVDAARARGETRAEYVRKALELREGA